MQQLPGSQYRLQFGLRGWASIIIGLAIFIAIATFLAIGFFVVVLPMIVLAPAIYYFMSRKSGHVVSTPETVGTMSANGEVKGGAVIDGEYRVIEADPKEKR
jgi:UPF0716 family protein affecting phage T7 exclusion